MAYFGHRRQCNRRRILVSDRLLHGDVVQDFAVEIGLPPLSPDQIIRINESLSLEASRFCMFSGIWAAVSSPVFPMHFVLTSRFISRLATIGTRKFAFSSKMLAPILEKKRDDIAWMEARLAIAFSDSGTDHKDAIDSLDDLVDIALGQFDAVQELLGENAVDGPATTESLVHALERLREQCYAQVIHADAETAATGEERPSTETGDYHHGHQDRRPGPHKEDLRLRSDPGKGCFGIRITRTTCPVRPQNARQRFDLVKRDYQKKRWT